MVALAQCSADYHQPVRIPDQIVKVLPNLKFLRPLSRGGRASGEMAWNMLFNWIRENIQQNKNAVVDNEGNTLSMYLFLNSNDYGMSDALDLLLKLKPDLLKNNTKDKNIFDWGLSAITQNCNLVRRDAGIGKYFYLIVNMMIEQGVDSYELLKKIPIALNALRMQGRRCPEVWRILADLEELLLENQKKDLMGLKIVQDILTTLNPDTKSNILPRDLARYFIPSNQKILKIKHAIEDNDSIALHEALEKNTLLEITDETGYTPFLYSAYLNRPDMMRYLIQQGANTNAQTKDGVGANDFGDYQNLIDEERLARERKEEEIRRIKLEQIENEKKLLFENIKVGAMRPIPNDAEIVNSRNENGYTPLMLAASLGKGWPASQLLWEYKTEPSLKDWNGNTALHLAIIGGHFGIANLLISKMNRESIVAKNNGGFTAYDLAMRQADRYKDNGDFTKLIDILKKQDALSESSLANEHANIAVGGKRKSPGPDDASDKRAKTN